MINQSTTLYLAQQCKALTELTMSRIAEKTSPVPGVALDVLIKDTFDGAIGVLFGCPVG